MDRVEGDQATGRVARRVRGARLLARAVVVGVGLALPGVAVAAICASPVERVAMQVRVLQSDLMVAALICRAKPRYNAFVARFETDLVRQGTTLNAHFRRVWGGQSTARLNAFVTRLANQASARSLSTGGGYCAQVGRVFDEVMALAPVQLAGYSAIRAERLGVGLPEVCTAEADPSVASGSE